MDDLANRHCVDAAQRLSEADGQRYIEDGPGWSIATDRLRREYRFADFASALAFVQQIGAIAEAENHHPDIHLGWGKAAVELWTHSAGGLSENDFVVAARIERAFARR